MWAMKESFRSSQIPRNHPSFTGAKMKGSGLGLDRKGMEDGDEEG